MNFLKCQYPANVRIYSVTPTGRECPQVCRKSLHLRRNGVHRIPLNATMKKDKKSKKFLNLPLYPGGKEAMLQFIRETLKYPEEALKNKIEGKVYIAYQVNDNGEVTEARVIKGIGHGCDEEAIRVVKLLQYEKVSNRGLRLVSNMKTSIGFKLNETRQGLN